MFSDEYLLESDPYKYFSKYKTVLKEGSIVKIVIAEKNKLFGKPITRKLPIHASNYKNIKQTKRLFELTKGFKFQVIEDTGLSVKVKLPENLTSEFPDTKYLVIKKDSILVEEGSAYYTSYRDYYNAKIAKKDQ